MLLTREKVHFLLNFVIPKSRDWNADNPGIRDWRKRRGFGIPGLQSLDSGVE